MKIRFKFKKTGRLKYIGHLDLLNIWNRAVKSAGLPVSHSKGFNPHMLMSFAAPLPLGLESVSEYVDVDFEDSLPLDGINIKINSRFPDGLEIVSAYTPGVPYKRIAAIVSRAEYSIETPYAVTPAMLDDFLAREAIEIPYKTKRSNSIINISPDIFSIEASGERDFLAVLSCGSARNLKPASFVAEFNRFSGMNAPLHKIKIVRREIFAGNSAGGFEPLSCC